tara:strand:- start:351 stop:1184 length:834 start_codon:yes stop_codon:yes gene_type:complete
MAKKKETAKAVEQEVVEVVEQPVVKAPKIETPKQTTKPGWEIKDRVYVLKNNKSPLSATMKSKGIFWFDEDKGYEREIQVTRNQRTPFVDEFKGQVILDRVVFRNGALHVPKNKAVLQKILSIYHPDVNKVWEEVKPAERAATQIDSIELELEAMNTAVEMDIDMAEAIMRVEHGSKVSTMSSKELKRDLLLLAKRNPSMFLELADDDNIQLRNTGIRATELGIIKLSGDNRTFMWGTNDRKLMTVPFDEHPYSALAAWFKTDEGMEVLQSIEKRLN